MTSQLIDLVNRTNNKVYENLQKLNSKFKKIQSNQTISEEEEYDSLNCKINIYFTTFIEQMKTKFILAAQEYERQIEQNSKDILDLIMENMLLKIEKDSLLEEKNKNDILSDYIDITIQKEKNSISANISNNLNKTNSKKKHNKKNILNNGIYSLIKSEFNNDNKNNNFSNNIYNYNLLDILNKNASKKRKKTHSYNKFNNNNYNFNFIAGLDLNHYNTQNKKNVSYNGLGKALYDSQDNFKLHKNKNSFSLNDIHKIKNVFSQKRTKKNSRKNIKNNLKIYNYTNTNDNNYNNFINDNYQKQSNEAKNISFSDNKIHFTEPSYNEHNKKKEKINFYCIKKIKEEMNEILKNKKSINTSNNNSNLNINTNGNVIDNANNANKAKLPLGYNYYPKNKNKINININNNTNKKTSIQNKTPKNIKTHKQANISEILKSDIYKDKNMQCKINYTIANNNQKVSPNMKKFKGSAKFSKISLYNSNLNNNNIYDNFSLNINNKKKDLHNNFSGLKNMKKNKINNNINSKSSYKLNNKKNNISNDSNKKNLKEKSNINNFYYNDNINSNISYNLANKITLSRNYSNIGNNFNSNTNTNSNYNTYYSNNNYKTINNFNKVNSGNINNTDGQTNITNINTNSNNSNNMQGYNYNNNAFSMKIRNRINLSKNKMNVCLNNNNLNTKNYGSNNISMSYLLNNKETDGQKNELKKYAFLCDENNKNETPSFYLIKK